MPSSTISDDLATLPFTVEQRGTLRSGRPIMCLVQGDAVRSASDAEVEMWNRLARVEDEIARLRDGLRWYWVCAGEPEWFGDEERTKLRALLAEDGAA